jgi:hypothetical protein
MVMRRRKSHDKRYKKQMWSKEQRLQAVSTYLMLGNMAETSLVTGIPLQTLKVWKVTDWFKEYSLQLQSEDLQKTDSKLSKIVEKALKAVEDRLDHGDAQFDQKTGDIVRIPVKAQVALKISTELLTKQSKLRENPVREEVERTIDDRLLKLSEEFAKFASKKLKADVAVDVVAKEVVDQ